MPAWILAPAAIYALAGLLRLARFGVVGLRAAGGVECFEGLPTSIGSGAFMAAAAIGVWLPAPARAALLAAAYVVLALAMISAVPFPKRGLVSRAMWGVVPLAVAAIGIRLA